MKETPVKIYSLCFKVLTLALGVAALLIPCPAQAQFTGNSQTNTISGVTSNWTGTYNVGNGFSFDQVRVINSGSLVASVNLNVGDNGGSGNSMIISNNSTVKDQNSIIGNGTLSDNNAVLVTGSGSVWTNTGHLTVGYYGSRNSLTISSGAKVFSTDSWIGYASSSSNNTALITGTGSLWSVQGTLAIPNAGTGASLVISNGGVIKDIHGMMGTGRALVTGSGSVWSNQSEFYVGHDPAGASLTIANGGAVYDTLGIIGWNIASSNNTALVTGSGSIWSNTGNLVVGYYGASNSLTIASGAKVFSSYSWIGYDGSSVNNSVLVTDTGSLWSVQNTLAIPNAGTGGSLVISNGGVVIDNVGMMGTGRALVTGGGSVWSNRSDLYVGHDPADASLTIANGGAVHSTIGYIGWNAASSNDTALVTGSGSIWSNRSTLYVGVDGKNNSLTIANDGKVVASNVVVAAKNSVILDGGSLIAVGGVTVSNNAILKGNGTIFANLTLAGTLSPGNSAGVITNFGNLTLQTSAVLDMQLGGTIQGSQYDFILVTNGTVTLNGLLKVSFINGFASSVSSNDTFVLLQGNSPLGGSFTNAIGGYLTTAGGEGTFYVDYGNNAVTLSGYQAIIPEPSTMALCAVALLSLLTARRRISSRRT